MHLNNERRKEPREKKESSSAAVIFFSPSTTRIHHPLYTPSLRVAIFSPRTRELNTARHLQIVALSTKAGELSPFPRFVYSNLTLVLPSTERDVCLVLERRILPRTLQRTFG